MLVNIAGTDDRVIVDNWFVSNTCHIEKIQAGGDFITDNQVDQLVSAMASFAVPDGVGTIISQDTEGQLQTVLASSWQVSS